MAERQCPGRFSKYAFCRMLNNALDKHILYLVFHLTQYLHKEPNYRFAGWRVIVSNEHTRFACKN
jgi:hypothetical protein